MILGVSALATLVATASAQPSSSAPTGSLPPGFADVIREFDRTATASLRNPSDIGYTLGVVTADGLSWTKSYGFADVAKQTPATPDTTYGVACGALTTVMLLQLLRDGTVHLSDSVTKYVPELPAPTPTAAPVTLQQLATHTAGLTISAADALGASAGAATAWESRLTSVLPRLTYAFEPGTHAEFSPVEEAVLALALSRAAHQPYAVYVKQRILQPLGMTHSDFAGAAADQAGLGYRPALYTTIGDLARVARLALLAGPDTVVAKQDLEQNYRRTWVVNSIAVPNPSEGFGVGFEGETWTSNRLSHYYFILPIAYGGAAYDAALWFEPSTHAGVILLHHGGGSALNQLIHTFVYTLNAQPIDAGRQELAQPVPYAEKTVTFPSANGAVTIEGTLTMPEGHGPFPAAILIPKGGGFDRDEQMLNHRPFHVLADALTRRGIAVLRTDGRGIGRSTGTFTGRDDAVADGEAALAYLATRGEIDGRHIGLIGHGDGGRVASIVANRHRDVAFVVLLGMPAVPAAENAVESGRLSAEANGEVPTRAAAQAADIRQVYALIRDEDDPAALERKIRALFAGKLPDASIAAQLRQWTSPTFKRALAEDPAASLRALSCPVLALYGGKDLSVPVPLNVPAAKAALAGTRGEVVEIPDVNQLFQTADVGIGREANWREETMAPAVLSRIATWVGGVVAQGGVSGGR